MGDKRFVLGLFVIFFAMMTQAQENRKFIPPDMTQKSHSFALPELRVDSTFVENLNTVLFDKNDSYMNDIISNPREKSWRHFFIHFEKKDSLSYYMMVSLWDIPAKKSIGFFQHNGFLYWFDDEVPPNIVLETKSKKEFSYKEHLPMTIDPRFWTLMYYSQTGNIEIGN